MRAPLREALAPGEGVGGFSLDAYMASLSDGLYFDATKTDRFFQENTGPTLADDVGEAMGLALDQRTWGGKTLAEVLAAATNMGGTGFSMSANGGTGTATESPSGQLNLTGDGTNAATGDKAYTTVAGATYEVAFTVGSAAVNARAGTSQFGTSLTGGNLTGAVGANRFFFTATGTTSWIGFAKSSAALAVVTGISVKIVSGNHGVQASATLKPVRQATGAKFDGSDDNWLSPYLNGSGGNFMVALISVPASIAAFQYLAGMSSGSDRWGVGINTDGLVGFGSGSTSPTVAKGTTDVRNTEAVVGISSDGSNVLGFVGAAQEYSAPLSSALNKIGRASCRERVSSPV